jgi:hypothetical protein
MLEFARDYLGDLKYDNLNRLYELMVDHNHGGITDALILYQGDLNAVDVGTIGHHVETLVRQHAIRLIATHGVTATEDIKTSTLYHLLYFLLNFERSEDPYLIESIAMASESVMDAFLDIAWVYTPLDPDVLMYEIESVDIELIAKMVDVNKLDVLEEALIGVREPFDEHHPIIAVATESMLPLALGLETNLNALSPYLDSTQADYGESVYQLGLYGGLSPDEAHAAALEHLAHTFDDPIGLSPQVVRVNKMHTATLEHGNG